MVKRNTRSVMVDSAMLIRAYGHASTETLVATPWKEFLAAL
jgi:hypothetical protein